MVLSSCIFCAAICCRHQLQCQETETPSITAVPLARVDGTETARLGVDTNVNAARGVSMHDGRLDTGDQSEGDDDAYEDDVVGGDDDDDEMVEEDQSSDEDEATIRTTNAARLPIVRPPSYATTSRLGLPAPRRPRGLHKHAAPAQVPSSTMTPAAAMPSVPHPMVHSARGDNPYVLLATARGEHPDR
jgi:hypothetical protein